MDGPNIRLFQPSVRAMLLVLAVIAVGACEKAPPPSQTIRPVLHQVVEIRPHWQEANYAGEIQARYETSLGFRINGKITERSVEVGDTVKQGALLAKLDPEDHRLQLMKAEAGLAASSAEKKKAAADLDRYSKLLKKKVVSKADYQDYVNTFDVAKARLKQAQAQLEVTRNQAKYTALRASQGGVITTVEAEVGQVVAAGQTIMRLALVQEKEVVIAVAENRLDELRQTADIRITLWADQETAYQGKVREISPGADPATRTYTAKITLLEAGPAVQLGMTATVTVRRRLEGEMASLPITAIFQQKDRPAVWLVSPETKQVTLQPVEVAEYQHDAALIRSGLKSGQHVVTAGVHKLIPDQKVRLLSESK
ncbi:MAG: efflux RND transporter periplasmic adaptor subunit [Gammaproteobacteria bacterium]|nr:efflux RND transporter periplasmic adaptor subunit [Gammaproteobacteria bacterium]